MTRRDNTITAVLAAFIAAGLAIATWRILTSGATVPTGPSIDPTGLVGWLLIIPALVVGQLWRGWMHGRTIRKGHWAAIHGKGLALALVAVALLALIGGAR